MIIAEWIKCSDALPPEMQEVETKIDDGQGERNERVLFLHRTIWWTAGTDNIIAYDTPTHWRKTDVDLRNRIAQI